VTIDYTATGPAGMLKFRWFTHVLPCGTRTVTDSSFCPTTEYCFHRMYFRSDMSFSKDARTIREQKENEGPYRR